MEIKKFLKKIIYYVRYAYMTIYIKLGFSRCSKCGVKLGAISVIEKENGKRLKVCDKCAENKRLKLFNEFLNKELEFKNKELKELNYCKDMLYKVKAGDLAFFKIDRDRSLENGK